MADQDAPALQRTAPCEGERVAALQKQIAELTEAVAARDTFIAVAAHELRNPMTPLIGQIDLLLAAVRARRCSPEQVEARVERMQFAVRRYLKRATMLLDVSRLTRRKLHLELEPLDLSAVIRDVAGDFDSAGKYAGIPINVTVPERLDGTWDRLAVEQIVENLVSNAVKYGACTPVEIGLADLATGSVRIQVRDHGEGIRDADRARIFQQFERAVGEGERRSGFGIGLWVVGQLVEAMGGAIRIEDAPGGGALFTVTLPQHVTSPRHVTEASA